MHGLALAPWKRAVITSSKENRMFDYQTLKFVWLLLIGVLFTGFAVTGGFDLGVNALLIFIGKKDEERRLILNSIGPTWEGNQVWLITAASALFAAWPLMYATAFSSFYFAFLLVLMALILRPPGIDYRSKLPSLAWRFTWDFCLFLSGCIPLFLFGVAFGNLVTGMNFHFDNTLQSHFEGGFFSLLNPYSLLTGVVSLSILLLHGALFIQLKTTSPLDVRAIKIGRLFGILFLISFSTAWFWALFKLEGLQLITMPSPNESFSPLSKTVERGLGFWLYNYYKYPLGYLAPLFSLLGTGLALFFSSRRYPTIALFCNSIALGGVITTLGFTLFPFIMPSNSVPNHSLTIWDATSSQLTLTWMLVVTIIFLPTILAYTTWVFRVMRGKINPEEIHY
jgi:cytochrome d ubiquinol oxidase subunit II